MPDNKTLFERLDQNTKNKINKYVDLAIEFNATHNIFARSNKKEVFNKDILDCLPVLEHIYENKSVMDLGSGGGFPGMVIGISKPKNKIYLVESSRKKAYFLHFYLAHSIELFLRFFFLPVSGKAIPEKILW